MNGIRKVLSLLLAVAMLLPTLALPSFAAEEETILFSYDFSNLAVGEKLKGNSSKADTFSSLHGNTDTSPAVIAGYDEGGNMCAEISNIGDAKSGPKLIRRTNFSKLTNLTVSYRTKGDNALELALYSGTTNSVLTTPKRDKSKWNTFEYRFDIKNGRYDVYMNGELSAEQQVIPSLEDAGKVEVRFSVGVAPGEKVYIDDIVFSTTDKVTAEDVFLSTTNVSQVVSKPMELTSITAVPEPIKVPNGMNVILLDDMEKQVGKLTMDQWSVIMGNGTYVNAVSAAGNRIAAFTNTDTANHGPRLEKVLGASNLKTVYLELDYLTGSNTVDVDLGGEADKRVNVFHVGRGSGAAVEGGWNRLRIEFDIAEGIAKEYVNDKLVGETDISALQGDTKAWYVRIACGLNQNQSSYLDNFVIYTPDDIGKQMFNYNGDLNFDMVFPTAPTGMPELMRAHPRLLVTDWDEIREKINTDYYCARWYKDIKTQADAFLTAEPTKYEVNTRGNSNESSHRVKRKMIILAFAAAVENSDVYKNKLLEEIRYVRDKWPNWGEEIYIVFAHTLMAHAIAYDWCYDLFTEAERKEVLEVFMKDGIERAVKAHEGKLASGSVFKEEHNQNMVSSASNLFAAIAIADEYPNVADYLIEKSRSSIEVSLVEIGPDGSFCEPMEYWNYGVGHLFKYIAVLESAIRNGESVPAALDISNRPGFDKAADFPIYYQGPVGFFNYGDSTSEKSVSPIYFYLANKYNKPQYAWFELKQEDADPAMCLKGKDAVFAIAFYDPKNVSADDFSLDKSYVSTEKLGVNGMSLRSSWNDADVLFAAMQGGDNESFHQHYSLGTFIIEYAGERFLHQTGKHAASGTTYNFTQKGDKDTFYHIRTEGNNTLLINPDETPGQNKKAMAVLERFESGKNTSYGILDMTQTHDDYQSAKRGMMMTDNRRKIIVQDEVIAKAPSEFYWFAHTDADVIISDDGKSALMEKNGKKLFVRLAAGPDSARFSLMATEPLPFSPNPDSQKGEYMPAYTGDKKLTIHLTDVQEMTLSVEFVALKDGEGIPTNLPATVPMSAWKADSEVAKPIVQTLGGSVALRLDSPAAFAGGQRVFVDENNYAVVPFTENSRTLVPVRFISENFGAQVDWNEAEQLVTVRYKNKTIALKLGDNIMDVNGEKITLDVPANTYNDRTLIPLRALVEALGKFVFWDDRGLIIISDAEASYDEASLATLYQLLSERILIGDADLKDLNPEITDYYVEVEDTNNLPQVNLLQVGTPTEANITQGNPASIVVGGKTYKIHFVQNPFLGSKYVANTITNFSVSVSGQMPAPETDPILPVVNVESSIVWGTYQKSGSIDGIINDQIANRWTGNGAQWIYYDLGSEQKVHSLALATTNSHSRVFYLSIDVSKDGLNWTTVKADAVTNLSPMPTIFELGDVQARFVRLDAQKASDGMYSSYAEVRIYKNHADEQLDWASWNDRFGLNIAAGKSGDTMHLSIVAKNTFGNDVDLSQYKVTYESKNPEIAEVDANGKVILKSKGVATVLVKAESFGMMTQNATIKIGVE